MRFSNEFRKQKKKRKELIECEKAGQNGRIMPKKCEILAKKYK